MFIPMVISAFVLPKLKVGSMTEVWELPKHTFYFSRPVLRLIGSILVGTSLAAATLACLIGGIHLPETMVFLPTTIAFVYSANNRLRRHPMSEFAMSIPLPYPLGCPMRRTKLVWPIGARTTGN